MNIPVTSLLIGLLIASPAAADRIKPHSATPRNGFVPNAETAIKIAVAVWTPIYGDANIERQKPYRATLKNGVWHVSGSLPRHMVGGVAVAEIQKSDAKILRVSHGR